MDESNLFTNYPPFTIVAALEDHLVNIVCIYKIIAFIYGAWSVNYPLHNVMPNYIFHLGYMN